ncbi:MAG TPA: hydroxyisourate hydrolase [Thermoanaerobaculia bacterium]|nr:hydroxyisourate hydrolase [Thermoanaerobaculia bacterium]
MSRITTHVLDTAIGRPAVGVPVTLELYDGEWKTVGRGHTDPEGRARDLCGGAIEAGRYRLTFDTAVYFNARDVEGFFPIAQIVFEVRDPTHHYHVPLLLAPYGYSTYRGT